MNNLNNKENRLLKASVAVGFIMIALSFSYRYVFSPVINDYRLDKCLRLVEEEKQKVVAQNEVTRVSLQPTSDGGLYGAYLNSLNKNSQPIIKFDEKSKQDECYRRY
jgi:hypothetical protein